MPPIDSLPDGILQSLARIAGDFGTGSDIDRTIAHKGFVDRSNESTKWKRLYYIFSDLQANDSNANGVLSLIGAHLDPARFAGRSDEFERHRKSLNEVLLLRGIEYSKGGKFRSVEAAETLSEAERRAQAIGENLKGRRIHTDVSKYCQAELMQENYYHAVFEAVKGLADRIRHVSGVDGDGFKLVDRAFTGDPPVLAINALQSEAERHQQSAFAALLRACFAVVRNQIAHEPKVLWQREEDVADYFTLISLAHYRLDECVPTRPRRIE